MLASTKKLLGNPENVIFKNQKPKSKVAQSNFSFRFLVFTIRLRPISNSPKPEAVSQHAYLLAIHALLVAYYGRLNPTI